MTRRSERRARRADALHQPPFAQVSRPWAPVDLLRPEGVEAIHGAALEILEDIGLTVLCAEARAILVRAGAESAGETVRLDRGLVADLMALAPARIRFRARNPAHDVHVGGPDLAFCSVGGPAFVADAAGTRRAGTYGEQCDMLRLVQALGIIHQEGGGAFEALDLPDASRHLDLYHAEIVLMDKSWSPWCLGSARSRDALAMMGLAMGEDAEVQAAADPVFSCIINTNSPLQIDEPMAQGLVEMARAGQCITVTPFTLAGAMAPVTLAGALAQQTAEALGAMVLAQAVRPGCPVIYGGFTSNVDMRTGAPVFGTPEYVQAAQISGQIARRIGVPFRSSVVTGAHVPDAQAAHESQMALWGAVTGGAHLIKHCAGWLGGGLTASREKIVIDAEMLGMLAASLRPPEVSAGTLALDAIREAGAGGHFFGTAHTLERYETAFHTPLIGCRDNYETWDEAGRPALVDRATAVADRLIAEHQPPPLDPARAEALDAYVARRKREIHGRRAETGVGRPQP